MIDLHTHSLLSDGDLLPSELVRRASVAGCETIAITDHVDHSNIDTVLAGLKRVADELNKYWDILVIPGVELTHVPLESFRGLVEHARGLGALIVVGHGESPVEPVIPGTNRAAIEAGVDILAHPGHISEGDASLAAKRGVCLEITCRNGHSRTNKHVLDTALKAGAAVVLNTDAHSPADIMTREKREEVLAAITGSADIKRKIFGNSEKIAERIKNKLKAG